MDISSWDPLTDDPVTGDTMLSKIKAAFRLTGHSLWIVYAGRTMDELFPK